GPVTAVDDLVNASPPVLDPAKLIGDDAKLLGAISLRDIIQAVAGDVDLIPPKMAKNLFDTVDTVKDYVPRPVITTVPTAGGVETRFVWKPQIKASGLLQENGDMSLVLKGKIAAGASSPPSPALSPPSPALSVQGTLSNFKLSLLGLVTVRFNSVQFVSQSGSKTDIHLDIAGIDFEGSMSFVEKVQELLPTKSLGTLRKVQTQPDGVTVSYAIPVPSVPLGAMNIENLMVSSAVTIPLVGGKPAAVQFALSQRDNPFQINIAIFGGTGFF